MRDVIHLVALEQWPLERPLAAIASEVRDEAAFARADEQVQWHGVVYSASARRRRPAASCPSPLENLTPV